MVQSVYILSILTGQYCSLDHEANNTPVLSNMYIENSRYGKISTTSSSCPGMDKNYQGEKRTEIAEIMKGTKSIKHRASRHPSAAMKRRFYLGLWVFFVTFLMIYLTHFLPMLTAHVLLNTDRLLRYQPETADNSQNNIIIINNFEREGDAPDGQTDKPSLQEPASYCGYTYSKEMDVFNQKPVRGIPQFKNPCWFEGREFRCFPYYFLAGAPKAGTTDLFRRILFHPDSVVPKVKETQWLTRRLVDKRMNMSTYVSTFFHGAAQKILRDFNKTQINNTSYYSPLITGDATPGHLFYNDLWPILPGNENKTEPVYTNADYIHHFNPDAKIIVPLRNPINRLWSGYIYMPSSNKSQDVFHNAVVRAINVYNDCFKVRSVRSCAYDAKLYLRSVSINVDNGPDWKCPLLVLSQISIGVRIGLYSVYLKDYLKVFPRNQVLVQRLEDRSENLTAAMRDIFRFLDMDEPSRDALDKIMYLSEANKRSETNELLGDMREDTRVLLYQFYQPFNTELAMLLEDDKFNYGLR